MRWLNALGRGAVVGLVLMGSAASSAAALASIGYELQALGGIAGRYQYTYTVSNVGLAPSLDGFTIDFDPALYDEPSLSIATSGLGNWSEQLLASVPGLPAQYDVLRTGAPALSTGDSLTGFAVQFTWLGTGLPGDQPFAILDPVTFAVLETGTTQALAEPPPPPPPPPPSTSVPETSTAALALLALAMARLDLRQRRRHPAAD